jgi:Glycosyl transferase family 2
MPLVTVLLAVHNGERHLREAMDSILAQTHRELEFLVIEDGSTDSSREIVESFDDSRIRLVANNANLGLARSLNVGLDLAQGAYIARQDADDLSDPSRLERQVALLGKHLDVALVGTAYRRIDDEGVVFAERDVPQHDLAIRWRLLFLNAFSHTSVMFRRGALADVGTYDEAFHYAQDYDLWSRIAETHRAAGIADRLVSYRSSPTSMTATYAAGEAEVDAISSRNISRMLEAAGDTAPSGDGVDRDAVARLVFGDFAALESARAIRAAAEALALQKPFAKVCAASVAERVRHRAELATRTARRLSQLAAARRDPSLAVAATRTLARAVV